MLFRSAPLASGPVAKRCAQTVAPMSRIIQTSEGKQVVLSSDLGSIWLKLYADKGLKGIGLTPDQAEEIGLTLWQMGRKAKRSRS